MRLGNSSCASIPGPISSRSRSSSSPPTTIAHCGLPIETCWKLHLRPAASSVPLPSSGPEGKSFELGRRPAHLDRAGQLAGDRRHDRPRDGADREAVLLGPAVTPQVEDRLPRPVARQLRLGAVGVEDPQLGDELGVLAAREQQDAVGPHAEVRVAEPLDPPRVQLPREPFGLEDQIVVPQRLPLLEFHERSLFPDRCSLQAELGVAFVTLSPRCADAVDPPMHDASADWRLQADADSTSILRPASSRGRRPADLCRWASNPPSAIVDLPRRADPRCTDASRDRRGRRLGPGGRPRARHRMRSPRASARAQFSRSARRLHGDGVTRLSHLYRVETLGDHRPAQGSPAPTAACRGAAPHRALPARSAQRDDLEVLGNP